jgi:hypothetical protein
MSTGPCNCACGLPTTQFVQRIVRRPRSCCPCTNLLQNPGFDDPSQVTPPAGWTGTGSRQTTSVLSGSFVAGTAQFGAAGLDPGEFICQRVPVTPGCCYQLSFSAQVQGTVTSTGFGEASVEFSTLPATSATACTPPMVIAPPAGDAILIPDLAGITAYEPFTLEVCAPEGARSACICFRNGFTARVLNIDNVVFAVTGGNCGPCGSLLV